MRVLLIQPGKREKGLATPFGYVEPLGLEAIAGAIKENCDVELIDMRFSTLGDLERTIASEKIDACGISSTFTMDYNQAVRIAELIKRIDNRVFVFVGGHHPSLRPEDFNVPCVDAVVIGEGEATTREVVDCLGSGGDLRKVGGLALNSQRGQLLTPSKDFIRELDRLPKPAISLADRYRKRYRLFTERSLTSLETTRGCPFRCNFCSVWIFYRGKVRMKSAERVVDEIRNVPTEHVFFVDDNFFASVKRAEKIADIIKREGIKKSYLFQARSDMIVSYPRLVDKWADIGLRSVFLGFEKVTQDELDSVKKHNTVENNEEALQTLRSYKIDPVVSFIIDPDYEEKEFSALRDYVRTLRIRLPFFTMLTPLPGTELYERLHNNMICSDYDFFDLLHPILPTRLSTREFCRQFALLYRTGYPTAKAFLGALVILIDVLKSRLLLSDWMEIVRDWKMVTSPDEYLKGLTRV